MTCYKRNSLLPLPTNPELEAPDAHSRERDGWASNYGQEEVLPFDRCRLDRKSRKECIEAWYRDWIHCVNLIKESEAT